MSTHFPLEQTATPVLAMAPQPQPRSYGRFVVIASDIAVIASTVAVPWIIEKTNQAPMEPDASAPFLLATGAVICVIWLALLNLLGAQSAAMIGRAVPVQKIIEATVLAYGLFAIVEVVSPATVPMTLFFWSLPLGLTLLLVSRFVVMKLILRLEVASARAHTAIVLTCVADAEQTFTQLKRSKTLKLNVANWIDAQDLMRIHAIEDYILTELRHHRADTLVVSPFSGLSSESIERLKWALEESDYRLIFMLPVNGVSTHRLNVRSGVDPAMLEVQNSRYTGWYFTAKRLWDIVISGLGIAFLAPLLLLIALVIKLHDGGPVFFTQERVGLHRKTFSMVKFRTMSVDAEARLAELLAQHGGTDAGNEVLFKLKHDPRITTPGRFLRQYSLDELPQLFNVFVGNMTLVGPRPPLPREVDTFEKHVLRKFLVRPGITGLWQTMGRSNLSWEDSVQLDLYYVENCSVRMDLSILARTFKAVISKDGAY